VAFPGNRPSPFAGAARQISCSSNNTGSSNIMIKIYPGYYPGSMKGY
jgi:hypothetical protein